MRARSCLDRNQFLTRRAGKLVWIRARFRVRSAPAGQGNQYDDRHGYSDQHRRTQQYEHDSHKTDRWR